MKTKASKHDFSPGDIVFAKMKGYPFWPARIAEGKAPRDKIPIFFYGTHQTTTLIPKDIAHYWPNKDKYGKDIRRGGFDKAMWEIENDPGVGLKGQKKAALVKKLQESRPAPKKPKPTEETKTPKKSDVTSPKASTPAPPKPPTPSKKDTPVRRSASPKKKVPSDASARRRPPAGAAVEAKTVKTSRKANVSAARSSKKVSTAKKVILAKKAILARKVSAAKRSTTKDRILSDAKKVKAGRNKTLGNKLKVKLPLFTAKKSVKVLKPRDFAADRPVDEAPTKAASQRRKLDEASDLKENVPAPRVASLDPAASKKTQEEKTGGTRKRRGEKREADEGGRTEVLVSKPQAREKSTSSQVEKNEGNKRGREERGEGGEGKRLRSIPERSAREKRKREAEEKEKDGQKEEEEEKKREADEKKEVEKRMLEEERKSKARKKAEDEKKREAEEKEKKAMEKMALEEERRKKEQQKKEEEKKREAEEQEKKAVQRKKIQEEEQKKKELQKKEKVQKAKEQVDEVKEAEDQRPKRKAAKGTEKEEEQRKKRREETTVQKKKEEADRLEGKGQKRKEQEKEERERKKEEEATLKEKRPARKGEKEKEREEPAGEREAEDQRKEQRSKVLAERRLSVLKSLQGLVTSTRGKREMQKNDKSPDETTDKSTVKSRTGNEESKPATPKRPERIRSAKDDSRAPVKAGEEGTGETSGKTAAERSEETPREASRTAELSKKKSEEDRVDIRRDPALSVTDSLLYRLHGDIRISMTLDNPDVSKCLLALDELSTVSVSSRHIQNHSELIDTLRKMRWFRGSEAIMFKASMLYYRFKNIYLIGDSEETLSQEYINTLQEDKEREERERAEEETSSPAPQPPAGSAAEGADAETLSTRAQRSKLIQHSSEIQSRHFLNL
ncbi:lens epithelium-derived growth factor [Pygocentrus nattereri]|uniref:lens epithelium-derived growth factor n=1 Tax=Pygocentrus nattereri TaxID=42514 RepID=UPI0018915F3F|nr:lens epithelium-derived growth factor [Pygocentrus nattereri]